MKNSYLIPLYSENDISPKAADVIKGVVKDKFPDLDISFAIYSPHIDSAVLVLGKVTLLGAVDPSHKVVHTYSVPQIMTKANAATVLASAIRQFIKAPEPIHFTDIRISLAIKEGIYGLDPSKPTAIDIETTGHLGKVHTPEEVGLLSVAFYQEGRNPVVLLGARSTKHPHDPFTKIQKELLAEILPLFTKAIYHNGKFDIRVLNRVLGIELTNWFDTMLAHHVLNQAAGDHKLKHLAQLYLGAAEWEVDIQKYTKGGGYYENIPRTILAQYNGHDVYWTYKLWEYLAPQIEADEEAEKAFLLEMSAAEFLLDVETYGIPFDSKYAEEYGEQLVRDQNKHRMVLQVYAANNKFNPGSPVQVKKFFETHGIFLTSTDEKTMNAMAELYKDNDLISCFIRELLAFRKASKMYSTYVKGWSDAERNGRVHPTFLVHGTSTGRLSSTGPNAQNVPRDKSVRRLVATNGGNN